MYTLLYINSVGEVLRILYAFYTNGILKGIFVYLFDVLVSFFILVKKINHPVGTNFSDLPGRSDRGAGAPHTR